MSISEEARELLAKQRKKSEQTQENLLERSSEQIKEELEKVVPEKARELLTETRQHLTQAQENLRERAEEEMQD